MTLDNEGALKLIKFSFEIKKRPLLFLTKKSITELFFVQFGFIFGYNNACNYELREFYEKTKNGNAWVDFNNYMFKKYNIHSKDGSELIAYCKSEEKAFDLFFEELEIFLKENNIEIPEIK